MTKEELLSVNSLKELWMSLFDESNFRRDNSNNDYTGLLLLLETSLVTAKGLSSSHLNLTNYNLNLKSANERLLSQLDWKEKECNKLKIEVHRLENVSCEKCSQLEAEMLKYKKKAVEAQNRMKSIANILRIGENIQDSQSPRKSSAFNLVSQMLLDDSPKRKKRCLPKTHSEDGNNVGVNDIANCTTIVPETLPPFSLGMFQRTPPKPVEGTEIITSPGDSPNLPASKVPDMLNPVISIDLPRKTSPAIKKNLFSQFEKKDIIRPSKKPEIEQDPLELNESLAEYVKEANSEFDKIWFTASSSKSIDQSGSSKEKEMNSNEREDIVDDTPEKSPPKKKTVWKMKEKRGPSEIAGKKRLKQMKLSVGEKKQSKEVDLSTLSGYDGGSLESKPDDVSLVLERRSPLRDRNIGEVENEHQVTAGNSQEVDTPQSNIIDFKPKATSTQKGIPTKSIKKNPSSPNYVYKRDTVRKKSERAKLDGWDCTECAEYYGALGESPRKLKSRMNKCSRHRDKFKQVTNTPPGYWNPFLPDTQECKDRGYTSFRRPKPD